MKRRPLILFALVWLLAGRRALLAATYYVSLAGSDSNPGTLAQPYLTIMKGTSGLLPGDTVYLRAGTYTESLQNVLIPGGSSWSQPVMVAGYPGESATLKPDPGPNYVLNLTTATEHYIIFDNLILDATNAAAGGAVYLTAGNFSDPANHPTNIIFQNSEIKNGSLVCVDDETLDANALNEFIHLNIHDCGSSFGSSAVIIDSGQDLIDHCEIHQNSGQAVTIGSTGNPDNNNIVRYSLLHDNATIPFTPAVELLEGSTNQVYGNVIYRNSEGIEVGNTTTDNQIYNNTLSADTIYGILIDHGTMSSALRTVVKNNIVFGSQFPISDGGQMSVLANNLSDENPDFVAPDQDNYHLQAISPAIDAGLNVGLTQDIDGTPIPQGAAPDIGAYEFQGSTNTVLVTDRYVSLGGNDSNAGTITQPWATLQHAADSAEPGMTIHVAAGLYAQSVTSRISGTPANPVRFVSDLTGSAQIRSAGASAVWTNYGLDVTIQGFDLQGDGSFGLVNYGSQVTLQNNDIHNIIAPCTGLGAAGIYNAPTISTAVAIISNRIHAIGTISQSCPSMDGIRDVGNANNLFQNNIIFQSAGYGIHIIGGHQLGISNNLSFNNNLDGVVIESTSTLPEPPQFIMADQMDVTNNIVVYNLRDGINEVNGINIAGSGNRYINNLAFGNSTSNLNLLNPSTRAGTVTADPQFVNYQPDGSGNYHSKSDSPVIDAGTAEGAPSADFDGTSRPQGKGYDIGPYEFSIYATLVIVSTSLPQGTIEQSYLVTLQASGGVPPYSWSIPSGTLPMGLVLSTSGFISGTPTAAGNSTITVQVNDNGGNNSSHAFTIVIQSSALGSPDLTGFRVYPSPWRSDLHRGHDLTFDGLPASSTIKIFSVDGRWVRTLSNVSGTAFWNLKNDSGQDVASGIYLYLVTSPQGKAKGKFVVIR